MIATNMMCMQCRMFLKFRVQPEDLNKVIILRCYCLTDHYVQVNSQGIVTLIVGPQRTYEMIRHTLHMWVKDLAKALSPKSTRREG